jgi:hypothetical protein
MEKATVTRSFNRRVGWLHQHSLFHILISTYASFLELSIEDDDDKSGTTTEEREAAEMTTTIKERTFRRSLSGDDGS